ncbi:MAG: diguanylate cyclase [Actinobacteria bacterium]|nr:diguanylate cyclase [Thermoleophilia bacterium]MCB9012329.1 diguanylate cyclase [Actinomycetota bacterium]
MSSGSPGAGRQKTRARIVVADRRTHGILALAAERAGLMVIESWHAPSDVIVTEWPPSLRTQMLLSERGTAIELVAVVPDGDAASADAAYDAGAGDCFMLPVRTTDATVRLAAAARRLQERNALGEPAELLNTIPSGIAVLSPDGRVTQANQALADLTGSPADTLIGQHIGRDPLLGPTVARVTSAFRRARDAGSCEAALQLRTETGEYRPVVATITAVRDDTATVGAYLLTIRQPTEPEQSLSALHRIAAAAATTGDRHNRMAVEASVVAGAASVVVMRTTPEGQIVAGVKGETAPIGTLIRAGLDTAAARAVTCAAGERLVTVLLQFGGRTWGQLAAAVPEHHELEARQRLTRFSRLAALAVGDADAREVAPHPQDALTGLPGNAQFDQHLQTAVANATAHGYAVTTIVIDVDGLKHINTSHGHMVGDEVLRAVAASICEGLGAGDLVARTGGEEFAWVMEGIDAATACRRVQDAQRRIAELTVGNVGGITASFGIGHLGRGDSAAGSPNDMLRQAEVALQWAKMRGGNCCVEYSFDVAEEVFARRAQLPAEAPNLRAMRALAWAVDARDPYTHQHSSRVADLSVRIASALGWTSERSAQLREAGLLHDVGKIAVPDNVLFKEGRLTDEEFDQVKRHAIVGARIVEDVLSPEQATWVRAHHERMDGLGYPDGLRGEEIPEEARVLAVADSWDVMVSDRHYKSAMSRTDAIAELRRCSGTQFWPAAVESLVALIEVGALDATQPESASEWWPSGGQPSLAASASPSA